MNGIYNIPFKFFCDRGLRNTTKVLRILHTPTEQLPSHSRGEGTDLVYS